MSTIASRRLADPPKKLIRDWLDEYVQRWEAEKRSASQSFASVLDSRIKIAKAIQAQLQTSPRILHAFQEHQITALTDAIAAAAAGACRQSNAWTTEAFQWQATLLITQMVIQMELESEMDDLRRQLRHVK